MLCWLLMKDGPQTFRAVEEIGPAGASDFWEQFLSKPKAYVAIYENMLHHQRTLALINLMFPPVKK